MRKQRGTLLLSLCHHLHTYQTSFAAHGVRAGSTDGDQRGPYTATSQELGLHEAFGILCNHFGHTPSVDVFLYLFEAKSPGKKLWVSFNGVVGRILLTLFQQSYKGFKGKFFRVCCIDYDCTLLDGFPLYWVKKLEFKKSRTLEELIPHDRDLC